MVVVLNVYHTDFQGTTHTGSNSGQQVWN